MGVLELYDQIEEMFTKEPDGRKKKERKIWKDEINILILQTNQAVGKKIYIQVK